MRGESHRRLGEYLARHYLSHVPKTCVSAFLIGCVEPDRNPVTYLKGSLRHQWLRGHNYHNAHRFMSRISSRLEKKENWNLFDFYTLGKLIHYTADAFTQAHNESFPTDLGDHRAYEESLQNHFLSFLEQDPSVDVTLARSVMQAVSACHQSYEEAQTGIHSDARFALAACCCVIAVLLCRPI